MVFFLIDAHAFFISLDTSKVLFYLGQLLIGFSFGEREMWRTCVCMCWGGSRINRPSNKTSFPLHISPSTCFHFCFTGKFMSISLLYDVLDMGSNK